MQTSKEHKLLKQIFDTFLTKVVLITGFSLISGKYTCCLFQEYFHQKEDASSGDFADVGDVWGDGPRKWVGTNPTHGLDELGKVYMLGVHFCPFRWIFSQHDFPSQY